MTTLYRLRLVDRFQPLDHRYASLPYHAESRRRDDCDLARWWSDRHRARQFDRITQPDGLGVWEGPATGSSSAWSALGPTRRPHEAIWAPIGYESVPLRLAELAAEPILAGSEERIAETQAYRERRRNVVTGGST